MLTSGLVRWGPIPWLLGAEIFPLRARAKGMALSTSVNWISNFVIAFITPPLFSVVRGGYYFILLGFSLISGIFVFFVYRETAGKTLEELGEVFDDAEIMANFHELGIRHPTGDSDDSIPVIPKVLVSGPLDVFPHDAPAPVDGPICFLDATLEDIPLGDDDSDREGT